MALLRMLFTDLAFRVACCLTRGIYWFHPHMHIESIRQRLIACAPKWATLKTPRLSVCVFMALFSAVWVTCARQTIWQPGFLWTRAFSVTVWFCRSNWCLFHKCGSRAAVVLARLVSFVCFVQGRLIVAFGTYWALLSIYVCTLIVVMGHWCAPRVCLHNVSCVLCWLSLIHSQIWNCCLISASTASGLIVYWLIDLTILGYYTWPQIAQKSFKHFIMQLSVTTIQFIWISIEGSNTFLGCLSKGLYKCHCLATVDRKRSN